MNPDERAQYVEWIIKIKVRYKVQKMFQPNISQGATIQTRHVKETGSVFTRCRVFSGA
jgi:hypothetical protein